MIGRADSEDLNGKVTQANKILRNFATNRSWSYIDNSKITDNYLNKSGLRQNERGSTAFTKNISRHLYNTSSL